MERRRGPVIILVAGILLLLVILIGLFGLRLYRERYGYSSEKADLEALYGVRGEDDAAILVGNALSEYHATRFDGAWYLDWETVHLLLNDRFYYGAQDNEIVYCLPTEQIRTSLGSDTWTGKSAGTVKESYAISRKEGDTLYLALDFVQKFTNFSYETFSEPNRIRMVIAPEEETVATVSKNTWLRITGGVKSETVAQVTSGETVVILEPMETWSKVISPDAHIGYVENKFLKNQTTRLSEAPAVYEEPEYATTRMEGKVSLVWHNVASREGNPTIYDFLAPVKGVNVVSPTWFSVTGAGGEVSDYATLSYVNDMHARGLQVWPAVMNFANGSVQQEFLTTRSSRERVIHALMNAVDSYDLDGINVDFESLEDAYGEDYIEFIRELSIACREKGVILSVDNSVPYDFNDHYHLEEQGVFADYVIIMGYDEHYAGSQEPGSVASIDYVTNGILKTLERVPTEKVINGLPFYTRIWTSNNSGTTSIAVGMQEAKNYIAERGMSVAWNETAGQNYSEATFEGGNVVRIWLEDAESIRLKLSVMEANDLAGVAAWRIGYETPDIWEIIADYVAK